MFFLLLTALSEHLDFAAAYVLAGLACAGLVSAYLARVMQSVALGLGFGAALASLYAVLYALLIAEDYALLGGALLLFGLLAVVMLATRRIDWYAVTRLPSGRAGAAR
jgi:inner membrane protein